jgi:formylglycine-generating enzyme required for sulfatase activity
LLGPDVPKIRLTRINYALAAVVAALASVAISVRFAQSERRVPARCPPGLVALDTRCCGLGQGLTSTGQCTGVASACANEMFRDEAGACELPEARLEIAGGTSHFGAADWDGPSSAPLEISVPAFALDRAEVTVARFRICSAAGACPAGAPRAQRQSR